MNITSDQLFEIIKYPQAPEAVTRARCNKWIDAINAATAAYEINTVQRLANFLGQTAHESGLFVYVKELWGPTPTQSRYEGRVDLGNTEKGDGYKFRGRGLIQVTGRANYKTAGDALGLDLINHPELLEHIDNAAMSAAWFWKSHGLNDLADLGNVDHVSDRINRGRITAVVGDSNGYAERKRLTDRALAALGA